MSKIQISEFKISRKDFDFGFQPFGKIARLSRKCVISEKLDGTNAQIHIVEPGEFVDVSKVLFEATDGRLLLAGSKNNYITPRCDNYGFAEWAQRNAEDLMKLGIGRHYGEWWGEGIQRRYGMNEKIFSLFNTSRWDDTNTPECCRVVPVIYSGEFNVESVNTAMYALAVNGSYAAPGFDRPEGIIVFHEAAQMYFKKTFEKDKEGKERKAQAA